jgi:predicted exporter
VEGARLFDQGLFMNAIYGEFRTMTLQQMLVGGVLVIVILVVRYRSLRLAIAACLPALLVGPALLELFVLLGVTLNLLHVLSLILVLGMGVDYGIFLLDAAERGRGTGPTLLGLALACMTTIFVFGALVLSSHPALYSVGLTTGLGMLLALVFSPVTLLLCSSSAERSN